MSNQDNDNIWEEYTNAVEFARLSECKAGDSFEGWFFGERETELDKCVYTDEY